MVMHKPTPLPHYKAGWNARHRNQHQNKSKLKDHPIWLWQLSEPLCFLFKMNGCSEAGSAVMRMQLNVQLLGRIPRCEHTLKPNTPSVPRRSAQGRGLCPHMASQKPKSRGSGKCLHKTPWASVWAGHSCWNSLVWVCASPQNMWLLPPNRNGLQMKADRLTGTTVSWKWITRGFRTICVSHRVGLG